MTVAGTAMTLPRRWCGEGYVCPPLGLAGGLGRMPMHLGRCLYPDSAPRQGPNSQGGGQAAPQRPDTLIARDFHKGILGRERAPGKEVREPRTPFSRNSNAFSRTGRARPPRLCPQPLPACR